MRFPPPAGPLTNRWRMTPSVGRLRRRGRSGSGAQNHAMFMTSSQSLTIGPNADGLLSADSVEKLPDYKFSEVFRGPLTPNRDSRTACRAI